MLMGSPRFVTFSAVFQSLRVFVSSFMFFAGFPKDFVALLVDDHDYFLI